jgi:hypothetical protein
MGLVTCRCLASARFRPSAELVNRRHQRTSAPAPVDPELRGIVEDFERLWAVAGLAEQFAANLVRPPAPAVAGDPYAQVLEEHHRRLVATLRRTQQRGEAVPDRDLEELADALVGFYLSRRLCRRRLDDWAVTAIATIIC